MGYDVERYDITFTLDSHAGDRERRDVALHQEVTAALDAVLALPQYAHMLFEQADPSTLPPAVRARALLALVEAAETLAGGESIGEYVDVEDVTTALHNVVDQLQWHAFEQQGEAERPGASARLIDGRLMTISDWLDGHNRQRVQ